MLPVFLQLALLDRLPVQKREALGRLVDVVFCQVHGENTDVFDALLKRQVVEVPHQAVGEEDPRDVSLSRIMLRLLNMPIPEDRGSRLRFD